MQSLEKTQRKFMKVSADSKCIKTCKKERITPKVNLSLKNASFKLKGKIATLIMQTETQNKYSENRKSKKELKQIRNILKRSLNLVMTANHHQKKLTNLRKQQERKIDKSTTPYIKNTVHIFSLYQLTTEKYTRLSCGLDHHIPCKFSSNGIHTSLNSFIKVL